jgi:hypothetical protein
MGKIKTQLAIFTVSLDLVRAGNFERKNQFEKLYETYVYALARLRNPGVDRNYPMIRLLILTVTKNVEKLSVPLKKSGAAVEDIRHSLETLKGVPGVSQPTGNLEDQQWITGFEERLNFFSEQP